jgi:hypothetical protein
LCLPLQVCSKFELVVSAQTYGQNRASKDLGYRWLARAFDELLVRYPLHFKGAMLDEADVQGLGRAEYSVCIKVSRCCFHYQPGPGWPIYAAST